MRTLIRKPAPRPIPQRASPLPPCWEPLLQLALWLNPQASGLDIVLGFGAARPGPVTNKPHCACDGCPGPGDVPPRSLGPPPPRDTSRDSDAVQTACQRLGSLAQCWSLPPGQRLALNSVLPRVT
ncbi:hypothetical protein AAFF_G00189290 [Aldrovandia affinis]|uniref:Uncharacterized protein n=1 Tax=Aldrovandia affinis TaxID=143900 RepID=A0AAD7RJC9_9TELE|nr:hypothetical protein AAFF_G00189290 [Aldrovandia affinis]